VTAVKAAKDDTLMMQQWREMKAQQPNALLLYRCGDFYEMFYEDAEVGSRVLGLTLTARNNGGAADVPLAGVPVRALNEYVRRLVRQGFRVAICDQVEDARLAKGIVRRAVVETVTPGVAYSDELLDGAGEHLQQAARKVEAAPPLYRRRVAFVQAGLAYTRLLVENIESMHGYWKQPEEEVARRVRENWDRIERLCEEHPYAINWGPIRPQTPRMRGLHPDHPNPRWKLSSTTKENAVRRNGLDKD
jgi:DNA mismatch repair protein MutS